MDKLINVADKLRFRAFCKKCYEHWISNAIRYTEDILYEERNFEFYAKQLDLL